MEGKCRPCTVQRRVQSEVEDCDWWKQQHLFISFIHLNSCESHECWSLCPCVTTGREVQRGSSRKLALKRKRWTGFMTAFEAQGERKKEDGRADSVRGER